MPHDFVPRRDGDFAQWIAHFTAALVADPERYGQQPETVAELAALQAAFASAYSVSSSVATRTKGAVADKDATRRAVEQFARLCAMRAKAELPVAEKIALGLSAPGAYARPSRAPDDPPSIAILNAVGNRVTVRLSDPAAPFRRARPMGVAYALVRWAVGDRLPGPDELRWCFKHSSKTTAEIVFPADLPPGTRVWICANWIGHDHKDGQLSAPVGTYLSPAGGTLAPIVMLRNAA